MFVVHKRSTVGVGAALLIFLLWLEPVAHSRAQGPLEPTVTADSVAARADDVRDQLEAIGPPPTAGIEDSAVKARRELLGEIATTLHSVEVAIANRQSFEAQLRELPRRAEQIGRDEKALDRRNLPSPAQANEGLLEELTEERDRTQKTIDRLAGESSDGEVRSGAIKRRREQLTIARQRLESAVGEARDQLGEGEERALGLLRVELAEARLAELDQNDAALVAERDWLTARAPILDRELSFARQKLEFLTVALGIVEKALAAELEERKQALRSEEAELSRKLDTTIDPVEASRIALRLETLEIQRETARYRADYVLLTKLIDRQRERSARVKRILERLATLVEKYSEGEAIAQRLLSLLGRLEKARSFKLDGDARQFVDRLPELNEELFRVDDQLYEFDDETSRLDSQLSKDLSSRSQAERYAARRDLRELAQDKKAALRDQQEVLGKIVDGANSLVTLAKTHRTLIDHAYREALSRMFWIRNAEPFNLAVVERAGVGLASFFGRLVDVASAELAAVGAGLQRSKSLLVILLGAFIALPWVALRLYRWLGELAEISLARQTQRGEPPGLNPALGILAQAVIWPLYIVVLAELREELLADPRLPLVSALFDGLRTAAAILGVFLFGRRLFSHDGWGQRFWRLSPELCNFLRRMLTLASGSALLLLVPGQILLAAPGSTAVAPGSAALARVLFLAFQLVAVGVVAKLGRRTSPLMQEVLATSRDRDGFLWRIWPLVFAGLMAGLLCILTLDLVGLRFAATRLWTQTLSSIAVIPALRFFVAVYVLLLLQKLVGFLNARGESEHRPDTSAEESTGRAIAFIRLAVNSICMVIAVAVILEIWGLQVSEALTSPFAFRLVTRGISAIAVAALAFILVQMSRAIATSALRPRSKGGVTVEAGRKLRTLAPLVQTAFNVVITAVAAAAILRVIGFDTAPVLAGVGILGLAVGFAAQSLIKDLINGLFILFEDSLSIGDIVEIGGRSGQVERVTLRAVTIRDLSGNVHVIPNGTIDIVTNMTKGYSRYLLDVGVAYREDVDEVIGILREIDEQMRAEPDYRYDMLEPIEILGLDRFEDSAVIVRARLKTRPIQQWRVGREFNRRIKKIFDERGIEIPFPHRTMYWGEPKEHPQAPLPVKIESGEKGAISSE